MEKIPQILTHDVAGNPDSSGNRVYFEREVRSYDNLSKNETRFMGKMSNISRIENSVEKEEQIRKLGKQLGQKIVEEIRGGYNNERFDIKGVPRGGAYLQQFITKAALFGKNINLLTHPAFVEEFEKASGGFLENSYGIRSVVRGAESVSDYYHELSGDQNIIFTGLNIYLDTRHSIDMLIGRSLVKQGQIDQIDLCEVKSSKPQPDQIESIHQKHRDFIKANKEIILNGLGTVENRKRIEQLDKMDEEYFTQMVEDRMSFISDFIDVDQTLPEIKNWDDVKTRALMMETNPILLAVRLRNITDATMIHLKRAERDMLYKIKDKIFKISIPVSELGLYHRLIKEDGPHVGQALVFRSLVAYKLPNKTWEEDEIMINTI